MYITTVSKWLRSVVKESYLRKYPISVISNGVNTEIFYPRKNNEFVKNKYGIKGEFIILSVASTWDRRKGLFDFMQLRKKLSGEYAIVLVGLSDNQIKRLPDGIIGVNRTTDQNELAILYSVADVVVSLSREETFGLTPVEGFACGTPAIVYNNTALPELITNEVGVVVETGDIEQVKAAILEIRTKGKVKYQRACTLHALERYTNKIMVDKYLNLYKEVLKNEK